MWPLLIFWKKYAILDSMRCPSLHSFEEGFDNLTKQYITRVEYDGSEYDWVVAVENDRDVAQGSQFILDYDRIKSWPFRVMQVSSLRKFGRYRGRKQENVGFATS